MLAKQIKSAREEEEKMVKRWCFAEGWERRRKKKRKGGRRRLDVQVGVGRL